MKSSLIFICMLAVAAVALAFYAPALRFGFFNDDPTGHFRWMAGRSTLSFFVDASGHGYYRPLSFALWQVLHALLGRHDPFALHLLNIAAHAANAALVCWLGYELARRRAQDAGQVAGDEDAQPLLYGAAAGLLFALYPFSYEAVPYVGAFVHPLVTLFILSTLVLYLAWRARGGWGWFAAAHAALALAVFTHENGVIAPLLILALEFCALQSSTSLRDLPPSSFILPPSSFILYPFIFAVAWLLVPKLSEGGRTLAPAWAAISANIWPFVQALVYPVAPLARQSTVGLALLALAALAGLYGLARALRQIRLLAFGLLIWALAALPAIVLLDHAYVVGSPRLFYLGSVGAALVWALPVQVSSLISRLTPRVSRLTLHAALAAAYCLLITFPLLPYTSCQLRYQGYAGEVGQMMAAAARQADAGQNVTFVNLPYFFGSRGPDTGCPQPFAFAPTGAVAIPPYADARDWAFYAGGVDRPTRAVTFGEYAPGWATHGAPVDADGLRAALATSHVFVFDLVGWRLHDLSSLWQLDTLASSTPPVASLGDVIYLERFDLDRQADGSEIVLRLTWRASAAPSRDYQVFTQLLDASGRLLAQHDGPPAGGLAPTRLWRAGDRIVDVHVISVPAGWQAGAGRVIAGMYDPDTGVRLQALGPDGAPLPDDAVALEP